MEVKFVGQVTSGYILTLWKCCADTGGWCVWGVCPRERSKCYQWQLQVLDGKFILPGCTWWLCFPQSWAQNWIGISHSSGSWQWILLACPFILMRKALSSSVRYSWPWVVWNVVNAEGMTDKQQLWRNMWLVLFLCSHQVQLHIWGQPMRGSIVDETRRKK